MKKLISAGHCLMRKSIMKAYGNFRANRYCYWRFAQERITQVGPRRSWPTGAGRPPTTKENATSCCSILADLPAGVNRRARSEPLHASSA